MASSRTAASATTRSPRRTGSRAITVPSRTKVRTPSPWSSCSTTAAIGAPIPNALTVIRRPPRLPVAVVRPRSSLSQLTSSSSDATGDAAAIADEDRAVADLARRAAEIPGALDHAFPSFEASFEHGAGGAAPAATAAPAALATPDEPADTPATKASPAPVVSWHRQGSTRPPRLSGPDARRCHRAPRFDDQRPSRRAARLGVPSNGARRSQHARRRRGREPPHDRLGVASGPP